MMQTIYAANAVLTFSIATDTISFPHRVVGLDAITKTLIVDFGTKFSRCKTFYICDSTPDQEASIAILPWLVLMRESASSRLRIGKGYYMRSWMPSKCRSTQPCEEPLFLWPAG